VRADGSAVICYYFSEGRWDTRYIAALILDKEYLLAQ